LLRRLISVGEASNALCTASLNRRRLWNPDAVAMLRIVMLVSLIRFLASSVRRN